MGAYSDAPIWQLKKQMCDVGWRIWMKGFCAGNEGNHSIRISEDRVICTPTGISKGFLTPDDICVVDMNGEQVEPNPKGRKRTSEVKVHLSIYKHRPDVKALIHSHPPHATAFAIAGVPLPEGIHPEAEVFLGKVRTAAYATPSTQALPDSLTPLIGPETNTVLMGNHGSVSFSDKDLTDAFYKLEILDAYCRILLLTRQVGAMNVLNKDQMIELLKVKQQFGFSDERLACAESGCVGEDNATFLAGFDVRPSSASCGCDGGAVNQSSRPAPNHGSPVSAAAGSASSGKSAGQPAGDDRMEAMVQAITDQIMKRLGG